MNLQAEGNVNQGVKIADNIQNCFTNVVGMENVKVELDRFCRLLQFQKERQLRNFRAELLETTHFAIKGARGSGKSMVAGIIGKLLCDVGVRSSEETILLQSREILKSYEREGGIGVKKLFGKCNDVTIVVENMQDIIPDEGENDDIFQGILAELENIMLDRRKELSIIFTGTNEAMRKVFVTHDALKDVLYGVIEIMPYTPQELLEIMNGLAAKKALRIHESARMLLLRKIEGLRKSGEFLNAITLERCIDEATISMAERYFQKGNATEAELVYLMPDDFKSEIELGTVEELVAELDAMTGLSEVKKQIKMRLDAVITEQEAALIGASRKVGYGTLHMVFTGNPGTGKTTVARLVGRIYRELGILPHGDKYVECTRSDLVGRYQGHTAKKVKEKIKEAMGGILFIDEAYALCRGENDSFGQEAVDELIAAIENNKDSMMVILAGYDKEMEEFLKTNSGFNSRIPNRVHFDDYCVDEMVQIFRYMVKNNRMILDADTDEVLRILIEFCSKEADFGNARGVRNLFEKSIRALDTRIRELKSNGGYVGKNTYDIIRREDIEAVITSAYAGDE